MTTQSTTVVHNPTIHPFVVALLLKSHAGKDVTRYFTEGSSANLADPNVLYVHTRTATALVRQMRVAILAKPDTTLVSTVVEGGPNDRTASSAAQMNGNDEVALSTRVVADDSVPVEASRCNVSGVALPPVVQRNRKKAVELRCVEVIPETSEGTVKTCT